MKQALLFTLLLLMTACAPAEDGALVGTLERERIELPAERSEPVIEVYVHEGAHVAAGERLLQLDPARVRAEHAQREAERTQAQRRLDELLRGPREERIREAQAQLESAAGQLRTAEREFERSRELHQENLLSAAALDTAQARLDAARGEHDRARAALDAQLEGTTIEELDQARAQLAAAEAAVNAHALLLKRLTVTAPRAGRVEALPWKAGSQPPAGAAIAILLADGPPYARVHVPAAQRARFATGTHVTVQVSGFDEFPGEVRWISADAAFTPYYALTEHDRDRLSYAAEITLAGNAALELPAGVPVEVFVRDNPGDDPGDDLGDDR